MAPTIATQIRYGLGNQMFQYAVARRISLERGLKLYLDVSNVGPNQEFEFWLEHFRIHFDQMERSCKFPEVPETQEFCFDSKILDCQQVSLRGYWQHPDYFASIRSVLVSDFVPRKIERADLIERIDDTPHAVAVTVRRGDYRNHKNLPVVSLRFYDRAMAIFQKMLSVCTFFVFSDQPEQIASHFNQKNVVLVPRTSPPQDLYALTRFRYHIIANSTFSWWGAWLCNQADKIVIAPRPWIYDPNSANLMDASWTLLRYIEPWNIRLAKYELYKKWRHRLTRALSLLKHGAAR